MDRNLQQKGRLLTFIGNPVFNQLIPTDLSGEEGISQLFCFTVSGYCKDIHLLLDTLLHQAVTVQISDQQQTRLLHGYVAEVTDGGVTGHQLRRFSVCLRPQLWFLSLCQENRIFHQQTVPEIVQTILRSQHVSPVDTQGLTQQYLPKNYCIQYNETTLHFLLRLLEEAGIYYYFTFTENQHTLHLVDNLVLLPKFSDPVPFCNEKADGIYIHEWEQEFCLIPQQELVKGTGNGMAFSGGLQFKFLDDDPSQNGQYFLISVKHKAHDNSHVNISEQETKSTQSYENQFKACSSLLPYSPPQQYKKPVIYGYHNAVVTGSAENTIHTDKLGRIKVIFPWDVHAVPSCWIRVTQPQVGEGWGTHFLPRVGQEVLIQYLDSDIDKPICIGAFYNNTQKTPYSLPEQQHVSGIKTSMVGQDNPNHGHEIQFNDLPGQELLLLQAQKQFIETIKHSASHIIGNSENTIISGKQTTQVGGTDSYQAAKKILLEAAGGSVEITPHHIRVKGIAIETGSTA